MMHMIDILFKLLAINLKQRTYLTDDKHRDVS